MAALDKILDRVPYSDGGFRRRLSAGGIVAISVFYSLSERDIVNLDSVKEILTSPTFFVVLVLMIYAFGSLIEVLAELFISRLTGNIAWAVQTPNRLSMKVNKYLRPFVWCLAVYPGIIIWILIAFANAFGGRSDFRWTTLKDGLHEEGFKFFENLPKTVKLGLTEPFGEYGSLAWNYLLSIEEGAKTKTLRRLETRNKDILVLVTALSIILAGLFVDFYDKFVLSAGARGESDVFFDDKTINQEGISAKDEDSSAELSSNIEADLQGLKELHSMIDPEIGILEREVRLNKLFDKLLVFQFYLLFIGFFLFAYFLLVKNSILMAIEQLALSEKNRRTS